MSWRSLAVPGCRSARAAACVPLIALGCLGSSGRDPWIAPDREQPSLDRRQCAPRMRASVSRSPGAKLGLAGAFMAPADHAFEGWGEVTGATPGGVAPGGHPCAPGARFCTFRRAFGGREVWVAGLARCRGGVVLVACVGVRHGWPRRRWRTPGPDTEGTISDAVWIVPELRPGFQTWAGGRTCR